VAISSCEESSIYQSLVLARLSAGASGARLAKKILKNHEDPKRIELPPMFSCLSTHIHEYPDTLSLKMYAHIQEPGIRPNFRLEHTDHPLSREYHGGITPERVKEIMIERLGGNE
jgi:hypothetical protein